MSLFDSLMLHISRLGPIGLVPKAPGTAGSFASMLLAPFLFLPLSLGGRLVLLAIIFVLGGIAAGRAEILLGRQDPGCVIIDELVGQWIAMLGLGHFTATSGWHDALFLLVPFLLFRLFDIWKPWPVHASENWLPRGWGIMIDDVLAGLWALIFVCIIHALILWLSPDLITL